MLEDLCHRVALAQSNAKRGRYRKILLGALQGRRDPDFSVLFLNILTEVTEPELMVFQSFATYLQHRSVHGGYSDRARGSIFCLVNGLAVATRTPSRERSRCSEASAGFEAALGFEAKPTTSARLRTAAVPAPVTSLRRSVSQAILPSRLPVFLFSLRSLPWTRFCGEPY